MTPFSTRLRSRRLRLHLTQRDVGQVTGYHANTVARWERGEMVPCEPVQRVVMRRLRKILAKAT